MFRLTIYGAARWPLFGNSVIFISICFKSCTELMRLTA
ncbi:hypothetical protein MnTg02_02008 [bacterium MnTg02]|nr:hypothetical protein MnTg02_02008 [bacterium MnTg02]